MLNVRVWWCAIVELLAKFIAKSDLYPLYSHVLYVHEYFAVVVVHVASLVL